MPNGKAPSKEDNSKGAGKAESGKDGNASTKDAKAAKKAERVSNQRTIINMLLFPVLPA